MKKKNNSTIKSITNPLIKKVFVIVLLILLVTLIILISVIPVDNIWNKILPICYIVAAIALLFILGKPGNVKGVGFGSTTVTSFLIWCACVPILIGIIIDVVIIKIAPCMPWDDVGLWTISICVTIWSLAWFLINLSKNSDADCYLDLYSTTWIILITIITTFFDLQEKKAPFVLLLTVYFIIQFLIKSQMCKNKEK